MENKTDILEKIMKLARVEIEDRTQMAEQLDMVLEYVAHLDEMEIPGKAMVEGQRLNVESEHEESKIKSDIAVIQRNFPATQEGGVWVPRFVRKKGVEE